MDDYEFDFEFEKESICKENPHNLKNTENNLPSHETSKITDKDQIVEIIHSRQASDEDPSARSKTSQQYEDDFEEDYGEDFEDESCSLTSGAKRDKEPREKKEASKECKLEEKKVDSVDKVREDDLESNFQEKIDCLTKKSDSPLKSSQNNIHQTTPKISKCSPNPSLKPQNPSNPPPADPSSQPSHHPNPSQPPILQTSNPSYITSNSKSPPQRPISPKKSLNPQNPSSNPAPNLPQNPHSDVNIANFPSYHKIQNILEKLEHKLQPKERLDVIQEAHRRDSLESVHICDSEKDERDQDRSRQPQIGFSGVTSKTEDLTEKENRRESKDSGIHQSKSNVLKPMNEISADRVRKGHKAFLAGFKNVFEHKAKEQSIVSSDQISQPNQESRIKIQANPVPPHKIIVHRRRTKKKIKVNKSLQRPVIKISKRHVSARPKTSRVNNNMNTLLYKMFEKYSGKIPEQFKRKMQRYKRHTTRLKTARRTYKKICQKQNFVTSSLTSQIVKPHIFGKRVFNKVKKKMKEAKFNTIEVYQDQENESQKEYGQLREGEATYRSRPFEYSKEFSNALSNIEKFAMYEQNTKSQNKISPKPLKFSDIPCEEYFPNRVHKSTIRRNQISKVYQTMRTYS
ncbi:unnamed protein product [Moneuplotes crassus]|uniref:Uncharacterized protein n=1 Tax=Euplotes crassus TaxID=5936 RepID=A0AAD2DBL5_EUPCR|nr:unnamed protein product [Moneuplotes crassus]